MNLNPKRKIKSFGFTVIELMVSMGILMTLFAIASLSITRLPSTTAQSTSNDTLVTDLRSQQTKAMSTDSDYGIHFDAGNTSYTLFKGSSFAGGTEKFVITLDPNLEFVNDNFTGNQVVFTALSGDIAGYVAGSDNISIRNKLTGEEKMIRLNKYGATY